MGESIYNDFIELPLEWAVWTNGCWSWIFNFQQVHGASVAGLELQELRDCLGNLAPTSEVVDSFKWWRDAYFSVSAMTTRLLRLFAAGSRSFLHLEPFLKQMWRSYIPNKIKLFAWGFLLNILQTRDQLVKRGILSGQHNPVCLLCLG